MRAIDVAGNRSAFTPTIFVEAVEVLEPSPYREQQLDPYILKEGDPRTAPD